MFNLISFEKIIGYPYIGPNKDDLSNLNGKKTKAYINIIFKQQTTNLMKIFDINPCNNFFQHTFSMFTLNETITLIFRCDT